MNNTSTHNAISHWRAEFSDSAMESAFRRHSEERSARHLFIALIIWAALILFFILDDLADIGVGPAFYQLLGMRLLQVVLLLTLAFMVRVKPSLASNGWPATIVEITGFPLFFMIFLLRPDNIEINLGVIIFLLITMYVFVPNRVVLTSIAALFGIAGTLFTLWILGMPWTSVILILILPAVSGYFAAHRLQLVQRQEFALLNEMTQTNHSLENEIERRKALEEELQRQATIDPLTGLFNRRYYEALFQRERERCQRQGSSMVVCISDLDHFKRVNDTYGHDFGDQMLRHVAGILQQPLRQSDVLGRFGGEEFILLLPDTNLLEAQKVVERLRRTLEENPLSANGEQVKLTATFAITSVKAEDQNLEEIVRRVDAALYEGKRSGRNVVVVSTGKKKAG